MESLKRTRSKKHKKTLESKSGSKAGATGVIAPLNHGHNLVGDTGDVSPHFFRRGGHNMPCLPTFFSLGFLFGGDSKIKMFIMFCVKSYSC